MLKIKLLGLILLSFIVVSCSSVSGSGDIITETREVDGFSEVELNVPADMFITQGNSEGLTITGDDNVVDLVRTRVSGNTLEIEFGRNVVLRNAERLQIQLNVETLEKIDIAGDGNVSAESITSDSMDFDISGSGNIEIDFLETNELDIDISGSGDAEVAGEGTNLKVDISGSGTLESFGFQTQTANVDVTGSGEAEVSVSDELKATVTGSGSVLYNGDPELDTDITGSGEIKANGGR